MSGLFSVLSSPFLIFSVRAPRKPRVSVRQGPGPTELFIFIIERETERERVAPTPEETEIEITDWSGLVSLIFSQITGVLVDSAVLAPLSVLQTVPAPHQPGPDTDGARSPLLRAARLSQSESPGAVGSCGF